MRSLRAEATGLALLLAAVGVCLWLLTGCAYRARAWPPELTGVVAYGRWTNCTKTEIPDQLVPVLEEAQTRTVLRRDAPPPPCETLEVGAMSWANMLTALGGIIGSAVMLGS